MSTQTITLNGVLDLYNSSQACQVKDWPDHKQDCAGTPKPTVYPVTSHLPPETKVEVKCEAWSGKPTNFKVAISGNRKTLAGQAKQDDDQIKTSSRPALKVKDHGAAVLVDNTTKQDTEQTVATKTGKTYLCENQLCSDVPVIDASKSKFTVIIKANKRRLQVDLQEHWSGEEMLKMISHGTDIPLDQMKLIHKGHVVSSETIAQAAKNLSVFQAIGQEAESEVGLNSKDISLLMKQLHMDRNEAVKALRDSPDVLDAIIKVTNKEA